MVMKLLKLHDFISCFWQLEVNCNCNLFILFSPQIKALEASLTHDLTFNV